MNASEHKSSSEDACQDNHPNENTRKIFFSRHGERLDFIESEWRANAEMPDDAPLTEAGEQQACALGERLKNSGVTTVFASPFHRTVRTASMAASRIGDSVKVCIEPGVCERLSVSRYWKSQTGPKWLDVQTLAEGAGLVDGISRVDVHYQQCFNHNFNQNAYPESTSEFSDRCEKVVDFLVMQSKHIGNSLVIGHVTSVKGLVKSLVPGKVWWKPIPCK